MLVRDRLVDIGLIALLVVVAFAIGWTLLTLNRSPTSVRTAPPPAGNTTEGSSNAAGGTPVVPLPPTASGNDIVAGSEEPLQVEPLPPIGADEDNTAEANAENSATNEATNNTSESAEAPAENAVAEPPPPVPEGAVELQRVGFSFVTGGAGACGIVLEPWRHIAVSRELLAAYGCGAEVTITLDDEVAGRTSFRAIVADTMNPSFSRTVNIYVGQDEPALQYGVTSGVLEP